MSGDSGGQSRRLVKAITDPDGKPAPGYTPTQWIATIKFVWAKDKITTEAERQINPFGLDVLSYRIDPEVVK
ncbi:TPA: type IV secretion system protein [Escherichia coli]